jgi:hypothetical protein
MRDFNTKAVPQPEVATRDKLSRANLSRRSLSPSCVSHRAPMAVAKTRSDAP